MTTFATVGLIAKPADPQVTPTLNALATYLNQTGRDVVIDQSCERQLAAGGLDALPRDALARSVDLVMVVGGDGTLLEAGRTIAPFAVPLLGINLGRLGFMVDILPEDMAATLDDILRGEYCREERMMLTCEISDSHNHVLNSFNALNDVVVRNRDFARMLEFDSYMNGGFISHHRSDGIIFATPTGSTAYALSGGGPILHPALDAIAMVPICPHTLSDRPIVVEGHSRLEVVVEEHNASPALATFDGQANQALNPGDRVRVRKADYSLQLIHPRSYDYFHILRSKLHWGSGKVGEVTEPGGVTAGANDKSC